MFVTPRSVNKDAVVEDWYVSARPGVDGRMHETMTFRCPRCPTRPRRMETGRWQQDLNAALDAHERIDISVDPATLGPQ